MSSCVPLSSSHHSIQLIMEPPDDLALGESASNDGSTSSIRSQMAKVLADKAALLARRRHAPKKQQLQIQQAQMQAQMGMEI